MDPKFPVGFNLNEEKLLCHMVLDDKYSKLVCEGAGTAYWRAFIVENRATHLVTANWRFRYADGTDSWYEWKPKVPADRTASMMELEHGLRFMLVEAFRQFIGKDVEDAIHSFYPPDDQGDGTRTIEWLVEKDLITLKKIDIPKGAQA